MSKRPKTRPKIGDERWTVEMIDTATVEALARKHGWSGGAEGLREFCEPEDAATYSVHASLDEATEAARRYIEQGTSFYGCAIIDHDVFEAAHDDRGNPVRCPPTWETQRSYEVAMDGERIEVTS